MAGIAPQVEDQEKRTRLSVSALQCELRALFRDQPPHRGLSLALARVGEYLGARYAVVHARLGVQLLSEEWTQDDFETEDALREAVNTTMFDTMATGHAKAVRLGRDEKNAATVTAAALYDADLEQAGAAAILVENCDRARSVEILSLFEGIIGYLALLVTGERAGDGAESEAAESRFSVKPDEAAEHPVRLAFTMAAELKNRHGLDMTAIGFVQGSRVKVVSICGLEEIRGANPGVRLIRAAMEECLDRREAIIHPGYVVSDEMIVAEDCRLHGQWSKDIGGESVASFPLYLYDEIIAIVSIRHSTPGALDEARIQEFAERMANYGALIWLSRVASRNLVTHVRDVFRGSLRKLMSKGRRKMVAAAALTIGFAAWLAFGKLPYSFTVPCVVRGSDHRVVSSPRGGVLARLVVKPGDLVRKGQVLAVLDSREDELRHKELQAELATVSAYSDRALAESDAGQVRIYEAQKESIRAQLAVVRQLIEQAEIRASQPGIILDGDLREKLGSRLSIGEPLFQIARHDQIGVRLRIPEGLVLDAKDALSASFAVNARPDETIELEDLRVTPANEVIDGKNVFRGEALASATPERLAPGMEGVAHLDGGFRPVWWVLTHRVTRWLRLRFWI